MKRAWNNRRGTSLVEILVVMVVLLVGIMTVVQMFPTGFRVVLAAESQTIATRLAQQELERWKSMSANLPTGILAIDENNNVLNGQTPGPPWHGLEVVDGHYVRGNALNVRQIIGETTPIPVGTYFQTGDGQQYGAKYTLAFSPIDVIPDGPLVDGIVVKSGDLRRRIGDYDDAPPYLRPGEYAVDYTLIDTPEGPAFHVAFPRDTSVGERIYYLNYSYWAEDSGNLELFSKIDQPVIVPGERGDWVPVPVVGIPSGFTLTELDGDSDSCARGFIQSTAAWSDNDPYEFRVADSIVGVIAFNPTGHGKYEYTAQGVRAIQARIDYRVFDLRIIREDRVIPEAKAMSGSGVYPIPVKLALRFILNLGDPTDDPDLADPKQATDYKGLITDQAGGMNAEVAVLVIDLSTGLRVDVPVTPSDSREVPGVDYTAGIVRLPARAKLTTYGYDPQHDPPPVEVSLAGRNLRFYYRADGDWSIQCHKAYATYMRRWAVSDVDYRSYMVQEGSTPSGLSRRLLFAACEEGKTVAVDYTYVTKDGVERKVAGEAHRIDHIADESTGADLWAVDLRNPAGTYISRTGRMMVTGISYTSKVIWRDGRNWRYVQMDTNLTRSQ